MIDELHARISTQPLSRAIYANMKTTHAFASIQVIQHALYCYLTLHGFCITQMGRGTILYNS